jgi:hypothetical protein
MIAKNRSARDQGLLSCRVGGHYTAADPTQTKAHIIILAFHNIYLKTGGEEKFWKYCIYPFALSLAKFNNLIIQTGVIPVENSQEVLSICYTNFHIFTSFPAFYLIRFQSHFFCLSPIAMSLPLPPSLFYALKQFT